VHAPLTQAPRFEQKVPLKTQPASEKVATPLHRTLASVLSMRRFTASFALATAMP
jgi:hypothetical protein